MVVTKRNRARTPAPVEELASKLGIKIMFADTKAEVSRLVDTKVLPKTRCGLVIDYGVILAQDVIDYFPMGIINSHFSLLPLLRGADPISFAILEGHKNTGVSLMKIVDKLDEGDLIAVEECPIDDADTTPSLTNKLVILSAEMLAKHLPDYLNGTLLPRPQTGTPTHTRKLTKEDGKLDFSKPATVLAREVRAYAGWPKSYTCLAGIDVVVTTVNAVEDTLVTSGDVVVNSLSKQLFIGCGNGTLEIKRLIPAGKKEMTAEAFLNGYGNRLT